MLRSAIPTRFQLPWGKNAGGSFIRTVPVASQIGIQDGAASYTDGFPPDCFTPVAAGGTPPFGQDINGVMNATTSWDQWYQAGAPIPYDATFAAAIGGYPQGAILDSSIVIGAQWVSTNDSNLTNPDVPLTSSGWTRVGVPVGMPVPFMTSSLPYGYVAMNALTIGNVASGADLAAAVTAFLFAFNWPNGVVQIFDSAGAPTTRGANPFADFAANKRLQMPPMRGQILIGVDTMGGSVTGNLAGVPVVLGATTNPCSIVGENVHTLSTAEIPSHTHINTIFNPPHTHTSNAQINTGGNEDGGHGAGALVYSGNATINSATQNTTITNVAAGGGGAHNNMPLGTLVYWGQRL